MLELIEQLKADILNGALPRGCPLRQQELSARYNVSRIPVRDAIAQLKNQGWLVTHGKAGGMVPELNWREAEDLYQMRMALEVQLLGHALPNLTQATGNGIHRIKRSNKPDIPNKSISPPANINTPMASA